MFLVKEIMVYIDNWVEKQVENILDVSHRHLVFTMPKEFRGLVYWNREILKEMCEGVAEVIRGYFKEQVTTGWQVIHLILPPG